MNVNNCTKNIIETNLFTWRKIYSFDFLSQQNVDIKFSTTIFFIFNVDTIQILHRWNAFI